MPGLILMYHRITRGPSRDRYTVSAEEFRRQMTFLTEQGYRVVSLRDFVSALEMREMFSQRSVVISFDDGFESTFEQAVPTLEQYGMPATFFLVSGLVGKTNEWMDSQRSSAFSLMNWHQAAYLQRRGFELGSHTCSHPMLTEIDVVRARLEIENSKKELENRVGIAVQAFAYPFGAHNDAVRNLVRQAGYRCACSTMSGFNDCNADRFLLRRIDVFGDDSITAFRRKLLFGSNHVSTPEVLKYYLQRAQSKLLRA
jgi:peptidoglycan/xylan/chitin deacetylase (PgdA/CDA1 family)